MSSKYAAFKEAVADTGIALMINFPLNMGLVVVSRTYDMGVLATTVFFTVVFTIVAIVRKTYLRLYFEKRNQRKRGSSA